MAKSSKIEGEVIVGRKEKDTDAWDVHLKGFKKGTTDWKVVCSFNPDNPSFDKAKKLTKGQKVVIKGKVLSTDIFHQVAIVNTTVVAAP